MFALFYPIPEFKDRNGRNGYLGSRINRFLKPMTNSDWLAIDQSNASIRIEKIIQSKISRRGVTGCWRLPFFMKADLK